MLYSLKLIVEWNSLVDENFIGYIVCSNPIRCLKPLGKWMYTQRKMYNYLIWLMFSHDVWDCEPIRFLCLTYGRVLEILTANN